MPIKRFGDSNAQILGSFHIRSKYGVISMSKIRFEPWVGKQYYEAKLYGLRILLLGESHYNEKDQDSTFTRRVVEKCGQGDKRRRFFTITARFILHQGQGGKLSAQQRTAFWDQVAFYNYVQELVGERARQRPTPDMWKHSKGAYYQVLQDLEPDLVVVLGRQLAKNLPPPPVDGITFCKVNHPSSGFKYENHAQSLMNAIEEARDMKLLDAAVV